VVFIELPDNSPRLRVQAFESPWGITDEILCYWDGILFGQLTSKDKSRFAKLLPTLDGLRNYPWPNVDDYASSIINILTQFPDLEVWCERDCDQYPVMSVDTVDELLEQLQQVQEFCLRGQLECPSFSYHKRCLSVDSTT
jgi:hypothetical protein